jgi:hypothetical protein
MGILSFHVPLAARRAGLPLLHTTLPHLSPCSTPSQISLALYHFAIVVLKKEEYRTTQAVGYSCVLFGWMTILAVSNPAGITMLPLFGLADIPAYLAPFGSLIFTSILIPRASFVGHLSGILAGGWVRWQGVPSFPLGLTPIPRTHACMHRFFRSTMPCGEHLPLQRLVASTPLRFNAARPPARLPAVRCLLMQVTSWPWGACLRGSRPGGPSACCSGRHSACIGSPQGTLSPTCCRCQGRLLTWRAGLAASVGEGKSGS